MTPNICLIAVDPQTEQSLRETIASATLTLWRADSLKTYLADPRRERAMCLIVDLPRGRALKALKALRAAKVDIPALIVADADESFDPHELAAASALDILPRPVRQRSLLVWIECILLTLMALVRERMRRGLAERHAA